VSSIKQDIAGLAAFLPFSIRTLNTEIFSPIRREDLTEQEVLFSGLNIVCHTLDYETSKNILPLLSFADNACKASWILSSLNLFHAFIWI
jgi:hypothetical protein